MPAYSAKRGIDNSLVYSSRYFKVDIYHSCTLGILQFHFQCQSQRPLGKSPPKRAKMKHRVIRAKVFPTLSFLPVVLNVATPHDFCLCSLLSFQASGSPPFLHIRITWEALPIPHAQMGTQTIYIRISWDESWLLRWFQWAAKAENHCLGF